MFVLNEGQSNEVTLRLVLESNEMGREYFDGYNTLDEMIEGMRRLVASASDGAGADGIERIVAIAVVPKANYGDDDGYGYNHGDDNQWEDDEEEFDELDESYESL